MTTTLLVDIGNTRIKWALLQKDVFAEGGRFAWRNTDLGAHLSCDWSSLDKPRTILVSNVAGPQPASELAQWCETHWCVTPRFTRVTAKSCGVINAYIEPGKLGVDRWLAMVAAWNEYKSDVCVLDCGSAVTIDLVTAKGEHQGGMIMPGISLLGRALTEHTHALAAGEYKTLSILANNTSDAINTGCHQLFIGGIEYLLNKIGAQYGPELKYIITGGDAELVSDALNIKNINLTIEPDLVLKGLLLSSKTQ